MGNAATTIEKEDGIVDSSISSTEDTYSKVPIHFSENMKSTTNKLDKIVGQARQKQDDTDNKIKFLEKENIDSLRRIIKGTDLILLYTSLFLLIGNVVGFNNYFGIDGSYTIVLYRIAVVTCLLDHFTTFLFKKSRSRRDEFCLIR